MVATVEGTLSLVTIDVTDLPGAESASISIEAPRQARSGHHFAAAVHLAGGDTNHDVTITGWPVGGAPVPLGGGSVDASGDLVVRVDASVSMALSATYAGDATWGAAKTAFDVAVRSATDLSIKAEVEGTNGRFPVLSGFLTARARLTPAIGGNDADFVFQRRSQGAWSTALLEFAPYSDAGVATVRGISPRSGFYRVRAVSPESDRYLRSHSAWFAFKV
jgi:hypothetical protein